MDYTIFYPTELHEIDPKDDNVDVCVTFPDGRSYTFVFATPQNLYTLMKQDALPYWGPGALPFLFVEELTKENIEKCIEAIASDQAMLRFYGSDILGLLSE